MSDTTVTVTPFEVVITHDEHVFEMSHDRTRLIHTQLDMNERREFHDVDPRDVSEYVMSYLTTEMNIEVISRMMSERTA